VTPKVFAEMMSTYMNLPEEDAKRLQSNGRKLLELFDRKKIAQQYINLANGLPTEQTSVLEKGEFVKEIDECSNAIYEKVFVQHNADRAGKGLVTGFLSGFMRQKLGESFAEEAQNESDE
jgi:hypothetical protein